MAPTAEQSGRMSFGDYEELLTRETAILRTFCLTINATGSELKYKIMDTLSESDFYFPVNKAIFSALLEMHRRGDYVVYTNLEEELRKMSVDIPEDLFLEDFFRGEIPDLSELEKWVRRLKERSSGKISFSGVAVAKEKDGAVSEAPALPKPAPSPPGEEIKATQIRFKDGARKLSQQGDGESKSGSMPDVLVKVSKASASQESKPLASSSDSVSKKPVRSRPSVLCSEGDEWTDYLEDLASKQGRNVETGFVGLDEEAGGLSRGLLLFADGNPERRSSFLKQLVDQIAARSKTPSLYLSFEASKAELRIRTLSRLSGVPAKDIERGRFKRDSPEWETVERNGRKAAPWLKRVFVVEADSNTGTESLREMGRELVHADQDSTGVMVIDSLEKLGSTQESISARLAKLKKLSEALDVLLVAGTGTNKVLSGSGVDYTVCMNEGKGEEVILELTAAGRSESTVLHFQYEPLIHRFTEQTGM